MPTYKLPPLKKPKKEKGVEIADAIPDQWRRTITIPVNDDILESLQVGEKVTVELSGEVVGTRNTESKSTDNEYIDKSIELMIASVTVPDDDADEREEQGMMHGFKRG